MPDVGGHVISREFSRDVQLKYTQTGCDFIARTWIMPHKFIGDFLLNMVFKVNLNKIK